MAHRFMEFKRNWLEKLETTSEPGLFAWKDLALVRLSDSGFEIAPYTAGWRGHELILLWDEVLAVCIPADASDEQAEAILKSAATHRRKTFRRCSSCGSLTAPEHRSGMECHACMHERGVVF